MSKLTVKLPDDLLNRLRSAAERQQISVDALVQAAVEDYLANEPTHETLRKDLRQSMRDALEGRTRPASDDN